MVARNCSRVIDQTPSGSVSLDGDFWLSWSDSVALPLGSNWNENNYLIKAYEKLMIITQI